MIMSGGSPYAIGMATKRGFRVRCIRFGKLAASYEVRHRGEEIRAVRLIVGEKPSRPYSTSAATPERF